MIKQMFTTGNSIKLCYTPWKYQDQKPRSLEIPDGIALEIPHAVSSVPLEIPCPQPPACFFSGTAQLQEEKEIVKIT